MEIISLFSNICVMQCTCNYINVYIYKYILFIFYNLLETLCDNVTSKSHCFAILLKWLLLEMFVHIIRDQLFCTLKKSIFRF